MAPAPFITPRVVIEDAFIDYNGHLNAGYYYVLFDKWLDQAWLPTGLGPDYIKQRNLSSMTLEAHVCYLREVMQSDPMRLHVRFLDVDAKRLHTFSELVHETEGWVAATAEALHIHVDMATRKSSPWPADILANLQRFHAEHAQLPPPAQSGRKVGIVRR